MPDPSLPLSVAERVDAACDRFEADWRAGRRPRVDDVVAAAPDSDREPLRAALLAVEAELVSTDRDSSASATSPLDPSAPQPPPRRLGRFEVRQVLGEGAFGRVYRALDPQLGREVAVKVPVAGALKSADERDRFLREARTAATLRHPNVCPVYEVGEQADGTPFIVMAYINGQSLAHVLKGRKEPLPTKQVAILVRKLALGLDAAHKKGIVHRDLKPANVMFDAERRDIVVTDFGLARGPRGDDPVDPAAGVGDAGATRTGAIMGTPAYMSPEQARGDTKAVGPASDTFALGVMLYELLTCKRPFTGSVADVLRQIRTADPVPPAQVRADVDPVLEAVCRKAMAKDPAARYGSMKEIARELDAYLRGATDPGRTAESKPDSDPAAGSDGERLAEAFVAPNPPPKRRWRRAAAVLGVLAIMGVVVALALTGKGPEPDTGTTDQTVEPPPPPPVTVTAPEPDPWTPLFNGTDLTGWRSFPGKAREWKVENGELIGFGRREKWTLSHVETFTDFALRLDYRVDPGGVSAVVLYPVITRSMRVNIGGGETLSDGVPQRQGTGALVAWHPHQVLHECHTPPAERPPGEWNRLEVTAAGGVLVVAINGVEVNRRAARDIPAFREEVGRILSLVLQP